MGADLMKLKEAMGGVRQPEFGADKQAQLRRRNAAEGSRDRAMAAQPRPRNGRRVQVGCHGMCDQARPVSRSECSPQYLVLHSSFSSSHQPSPIMESLIACLLIPAWPHSQPNPSPVQRDSGDEDGGGSAVVDGDADVTIVHSGGSAVQCSADVQKEREQRG
ncbi:uncharacterized protein CLUP02_11440 [Colletotrichum lupini]|uniref:Uncharacterized protein n=1 Tax=Colletotrichum lupini TaxID=145971 RepID=A0A9Q8WJU3_9PEZI|nr:uncharacterized protein CLUP02_11440 [Colletotrichum lupini]UQC85941.1 hypothetical protein CLUP02_11440 [Colletotrichum lupini]